MHAELVGNHPALDLVNTVGWRLAPGRAVDRLADGQGLLRWADAAGLMEAGTAAQGAREADVAAAELRELRELLHRVLQPAALDARPDDAAVADLRRHLLAALGRDQVEVDRLMPLRWEVAVRTVGDLPTRLAVEAWDLLVREDVRRLRQCRDDECGWLFLDRSRNGSRVWCSSADCGNRARARRHYARHHLSHGGSRAAAAGGRG